MLSQPACNKARSPRGLKALPSVDTVNIGHLACKIELFAHPALHCFTVHIAEAHTAPGHEFFFKRGSALHGMC